VPPKGQGVGVAGANGRIDQAADLHRHAAAAVQAATAALDTYLPPPRTDLAEQHDLAERLRAAAAWLTPGWLGAPWEAGTAATPLGDPNGQRRPEFVRVGVGKPAEDAQFPAIVPLLGTGHLTFSADSRDPRVAGALRSILLRLLATAPAGTLIVRAVDAVGGALFAPFDALAAAGLMPPPVTDRTGLQAVLSEAEHWVRPSRPEELRRPTSRPRRRDCTMLLVIAALPSAVEGAELARIAALAQAGPAAGLHLIVAGWPPAPLTPDTAAALAQAPLPLSAQVALRNPYALISLWTPTPPDGGQPSPATSWSGLSVPVYLDGDPPAELVHRVCQELAQRFAEQGQVHLMDLLPDPDHWWAESSAAGLSTTVGLAGDTPIQLRFADLTPHWLVGGRSGGGKTAFLVNVLYGLATRYDPDELTFYLLDFKEGVSFSEFTPTAQDPSWLPHARSVGVESDREYGLAVLRELDDELTRRAGQYKEAGVSRFGQFRDLGIPMPRIVCVIDEFQVLLAGTDTIATEAVSRLESIARKGRSFGLHLILCSQTVRGIEALYAKRDSIFGQFPVRVALPGGGDVLEATNDSAATLPLGYAVVNTAGGLGGPRGAIRGHEKNVRFPDPHADTQVLSALRQRLWQAREPQSSPPIVFAGYASPALPVEISRASDFASAYLGQHVDVELSPATFAFDDTPGRNLAVLGPSELGAQVLAAAARSLLAQGRQCVLVSAVPAVHGLLTAVPGAAVLAPGGLADLPTDGFVLVFGADGIVNRAVLRQAADRGTAVLGWWRQPRRFLEDTGGSAGRDDVAGLVLLNVSGQDASLLVGSMDAAVSSWQPRANRALVHDRHTGISSVIVPYASKAPPAPTAPPTPGPRPPRGANMKTVSADE
jgi:DNA segregation ATPase FtsK/SpoIIIE, S-DNA-T family